MEGKTVCNYVNNIYNAKVKSNKHDINTASSPSTPIPIPNKSARSLSPFKKFQMKQMAKGLVVPLKPSKSRWTTQHVPVLANVDSGATGNYLTLADIHVLRDVQISNQVEQISVAVANGMLLRSTHHGFLDVPGHGQMIAHIFPALKGSLLSVSQLVNIGLGVTYCNNFITAFDKDSKIVFQGDRDMNTGLFMVDLRLLSTANSGISVNIAGQVVRLDTAADFVNFWHAAYGSPAVSTFLFAIDNNFIRVPGLTSAKVRRNPPNSLATALGHLHATRKGIKSTKKDQLIARSVPISDDSCETIQEQRERRIWWKVDEICTGRAHSDTTGALPVSGRKTGALYQCIFYHEDSNVIHVETTKSRSGPDLLAALQRAVSFFSERGAAPVLIRMDNECAAVTKTWLKATAIELELTPVAHHRTNKAERAISTWKDHFISVLATTDPNSPLILWEDYVEQSELTLNCMRSSPAHPLLSAWEALCGRFDIMATPIAPLGMKVLVHDTPENRGSWQVHGKVGYYIGRALSHYRCHSVYMVDSRAIRISDCLAWFPVNVKMPGSSPIEELTASVENVRRILAKISTSHADPAGRQPLQEAEAILADQLQAVRQLFQPTPTAQDQRVQPLPPSAGVWPRGQQLQPLQQSLQQHQIVLQSAPTGIAFPLPLSTPASKQRVQKQKSPTATQAVSDPLVNSNTLIIPARATQPVRLPPKPKSKHHYVDLSPDEIRKISKQKFKCVGMQFMDDEDQFDTATGVVIGLVRHKKSKELVFKYWNHQVYDTEPVNESDFEFINVDYAVNNCKWSKHQSTTKRLSTAMVTARIVDDEFRNLGPTRNSIKQAKKRSKLARANSALEQRVPEPEIVNAPPIRTLYKNFEALSDIAMQKVPQQAKQCIGKQYRDNNNASTVGTVSTIVRHVKSRRLYFQTWNHERCKSRPLSLSDTHYINALHAVRNFTWNSGNAMQSPNLHAANVSEYTQIDYHLFHACTALDLNEDGTRLTSASSLKGPDKLLWEKAHGEEIVRLIESETGRFIHRREMPKDRQASYYNPQCKIKIKPDGSIQRRVRGTIGGDKVHYPGDTAAFVAHLETIRLHINAAVSEDAELCTADISDFYLGTPLDRKEYMSISLKHIPIDIQERYNILGMVHNGYILMEISKGIYGLPQAGKLSQDRLVKHLASNDYTQCVNTPCLFKHKTNGVVFTLVVDDFLIKYKSRENVDHLLNSLRELYKITTDFSRESLKYVGITLRHDRKKRHIDMSIPGYVEKALKRFQRTNLKGADSPIIYVPPSYGKHQQEAPVEEPSTPLAPAEIQELQEIVGVFLFYARAVDPTMLTAINKIASRQSKATSLIRKEVDRFLQYASKYPNATMRVRASNMKLVAHSDGSYLSESEARSRAGGILFLGDCADNEAPNAPVCFLSVIIKTVVTSAAATEYAAAFIVGQAAISIINTLADLGYPQAETEIFCDNLCAVGIANNTFNLKRTKTIDMRYHWIRDQVKMKVFKITWKAGKLNLADYFTKAHPVKHHVNIRWKYVLMQRSNTASSEGVLLHQ